MWASSKDSYRRMKLPNSSSNASLERGYGRNKEIGIDDLDDTDALRLGWQWDALDQCTPITCATKKVKNWRHLNVSSTPAAHLFPLPTKYHKWNTPWQILCSLFHLRAMLSPWRDFQSLCAPWVLANGSTRHLNTPSAILSRYVPKWNGRAWDACLLSIFYW